MGVKEIVDPLAQRVTSLERSGVQGARGPQGPAGPAGASVAFDSTVPTTSAIGDVAATGSASTASRQDHTHGREDLDQSNTAPTAAETIAANYSAVVVGPYMIASGVLVTISSGGVFAVL